MKNLPEINFATADVNELETQCKTIVEEYLGRTLAKSDPVYLLIKSFLAVIIQQRLLIDEVAKQNLLAYSTDDYLDHLGALVGVERLAASKAFVTVEVELSTAREQTTVIKKGTRVTADNQIFFALNDDVIFAPGETSKTCAATCTTTGAAGNYYAVGEINKIVENQAWLKSIVNTSMSEGGSDIEDDDDLRERIHMAPESYSCAGSAGAYKFHALSASALISDVFVSSSAPGVVDLYILLEDGNLPGQEILDLVYDKLNKNTVRPLTDVVRVHAPTQLNYDIDATYYISQDDSSSAAQIISAVETAVDDYIKWHGEKLGRDLNPSELIYRLKAAGVKRVDVQSPVYTEISEASVAVPVNVNVTYAGLEDD